MRLEQAPRPRSPVQDLWGDDQAMDVFTAESIEAFFSDTPVMPPTPALDVYMALRAGTVQETDEDALGLYLRLKSERKGVQCLATT